jgi:hypothetical protein
MRPQSYYCHSPLSTIGLRRPPNSETGNLPGRFGPGTARHLVAFVAALLALPRLDAEPLALAQKSMLRRRRIVTLPALARSGHLFPTCSCAFAIGWRVPCSAACLCLARCLRILRSLAPILPLLGCSFAQAPRDTRSRTMPRRRCLASPYLKLSIVQNDA